MLLIGQFLYYELSYNRDIKNVDHIYRLADSAENSYNIDYTIKDQIVTGVAGVKNVCLLNHFKVDANVGNEVFPIKHMLIVDSNFFNVFNIQFIAGNSKEALNTLDGIVLTEATANRIFGTTNIIGKTLRLDHRWDMLVTGVVKDLSGNMSINADVFVNAANSPKRRLTIKMSCWNTSADDRNCKYLFNVFIELDKTADIQAVKKQIASLHRVNKDRFPEHILLVPLKDNYFNAALQDSDLLHGNIDLMNILSVVGVVILLLAVINFVNLTTAGYRYRLTEIGIKKSFGASRFAIMRQLLSESLFACGISSVLGIILAEMFLSYFNQFVDKQLGLQIFTDMRFFLLFVLAVALLGFITGLFPALILSGITPLQLFKLNPFIKGSGKGYRGLLTTLQFSITIILLCGLLVITKQINFVKHKNLGFNTERLIYLHVPFAAVDRTQALFDKLQQYHGMKSLTKTLGIPGDVEMSLNGYETMIIDSTSLKTFGFEIIKGRNLLPSETGKKVKQPDFFPGLGKACLVNAEALKGFDGGQFENHNIMGSEIVGVVANFTYSSLYTKTAPLLLMYSPVEGANYITIRISGPVNKAVDYITKIWEEVYPDYRIDFGFYDDYFASMYKKEENLATLVSIFSILAVSISCMGIFGLSVFQSEQKIKEIGIRKVLGASIAEIMLLLVRNFSKWVIFANIISVPVAYYCLTKWLQNFAYKIELSWWIFALAGGIAFAIALATIGFQAVKAATANPVESLRYE